MRLELRFAIEVMSASPRGAVDNRVDRSRVLRFALGQMIGDAEEDWMRFVFSLFILLVTLSAGYAQSGAGTLEGVYGPPQSTSGHLRGVFNAPQEAPPPPAFGTSAPVPSVSLPGSGDVVGRLLPEGVKPSPMSERPGYGRATVNGHSAIIDLGTNRIVQYAD